MTRPYLTRFRAAPETAAEPARLPALHPRTPYAVQYTPDGRGAPRTLGLYVSFDAADRAAMAHRHNTGGDAWVVATLRIRRAGGEVDVVSPLYAAERAARADGDDSHPGVTGMYDLLLGGATLETCSYLYRIDEVPADARRSA